MLIKIFRKNLSMEAYQLLTLLYIEGYY